MARNLRDDKVLSKLLDSYSKAMANPDQELHYLWDIRDCLSTHVVPGEGSKRMHQRLSEFLEIDAQSLEDFGKIVNDPMYSTSRHRGKLTFPRYVVQS